MLMADQADKGTKMRFGAMFGAALAAVLPAAAPAGAGTADVPTADELVSARLVAESRSVTPNTTLWVALHFQVKPGWHIYWRNPGDSGLAPAVAWNLPTGFRAGAIEWPAPHRFVTGGLANYGYTGAVALLTPITAPPALDPAGPIRLDADVTYLVCSEICIPGEAKLTLDLSGGNIPAVDPEAEPLFVAARAQLPRPAPFDTRFSVGPKGYRLLLPASALAAFRQPTVEFFPFDGNVIDHAAAETIEKRDDGIALVLARPGTATGEAPATLDGVLTVRDGAGVERAYTISAARAAAEPPGLAVPWWQAILFGFLGGIVLNAMPCVFPILSLKILGLTTIAHRDDRHHHGLAYAAGVVLSFAALGGGLLMLRAGGGAIGWGFQLQSPIVVGLLAYLLLAMGLSLSGVAEFGAGLADAGSRFADRGGLAGAFATGVLATIVATPCTAPFMGAALGFALVAPAALGLAVFVALGAGLAAPFLLVSWVPPIARLLPRPGGWMLLAKQILAFPLYGTVAWLVWVLIQEVEPASAMAVLFGLVAVGFAVWVYGRTRLLPAAPRHIGTGLAACAVAAAVVLAITVVPSGAGTVTAAARGGLPYEAFSAARIATLTAEKRPVFVNLTASWCITCLVNERTALDSEAVRRGFAAHGIVALKGDWTRQNPEITTFLQKYGRSGVPLYLLYDGRGNATVLPQILTESLILDAVNKI
jgi:thiol:disulfide interchange protein DsbD